MQAVHSVLECIYMHISLWILFQCVGTFRDKRWLSPKYNFEFPIWDWLVTVRKKKFKVSNNSWNVPDVKFIVSHTQGKIFNSKDVGLKCLYCLRILQLNYFFYHRYQSSQISSNMLHSSSAKSQSCFRKVSKDMCEDNGLFLYLGLDVKYEGKRFKSFMF